MCHVYAMYYVSYIKYIVSCNMSCTVGHTCAVACAMSIMSHKYIAYQKCMPYQCMSIVTCQSRQHGGFHFVYNLGVAETLEMRDEGATFGLFPRKQEFHPGCAGPDTKTTNASFRWRNNIEATMQ